MKKPAVLVAMAVLLGGAALAAWLWRSRGASPPEAALAGVDPAVARAVETARSRVLESPSSAGAWGSLGMVFFAHDFFSPARSCFAEAARLDGRDPRWPYLEALVLLKGIPEPPAALERLERAAALADELAGKEPAARLKLGELCLEQGQIDRAEKEFKKALAAQPKNPRALLGLGRAASLRGDLDQALERLSAAASLAPRVKAARALLAEVHFRRGDREAAERERSLLPGLPEVHYWPDPWYEPVLQRWVGATAALEGANDLFQRGQRDQAAEFLRGTLRDHPDALLVHLLLGRLLLQMDRLPEAEQALREAARRAPDAFETHFELGTALIKQGKEQEAVESFRRTIALKASYGPAHYSLGKCLIRRGDHAAALEEFRANVRYHPDHAQGQRDLGILLAQMGRRAEAAERLQNAIRLNPADAEARQLLEAVLQKNK
ncbi:MAG: tetratricopeptide repeat protein [Planctomycetes bacterium]|nr:tetratricopeptide repeat protein [Planctomycetota bacterium]